MRDTEGGEHRNWRTGRTDSEEAAWMKQWAEDYEDELDQTNPYIRCQAEGEPEDRLTWLDEGSGFECQWVFPGEFPEGIG